MSAIHQQYLQYKYQVTICINQDLIQNPPHESYMLSSTVSFFQWIIFVEWLHLRIKSWWFSDYN